MKVKDLMIVDVVTVSPETKITEVSEILFKKRLHAVPVVEEGKIVGIIAEDDFFIRGQENIFLPSYIKFIKGSKVVDDLSQAKKTELRYLMNLKAKDIMTKECVSILEDMSISDLLEFFRETKFTTLPVINSANKLVGIITISDILRLVKA